MLAMMSIAKTSDRRTGTPNGVSRAAQISQSTGVPVEYLRKVLQRLTRARLIAFTKLPQEQRQLITAARRKAFEVDRAVMEADQKLVDELLPTLDASVRSAYPQT